MASDRANKSKISIRGNPVHKAKKHGHEAKPLALVIGMPWFRSGTGTVMQSQITYFNQLDWRTTFVCVPRFPDDFSPPSKMLAHYRQAAELGADDLHFADYWPHEFRQKETSLRRIRNRLSQIREDALQSSLKTASDSEISPDLQDTLSSTQVGVILINHVYAIPFGMKIVEYLKRQGKRAPIISVTHDVQTLIMIDNDQIPGTSNELAFEELSEFRTELKFLEKSDALVHVSDVDKAFFMKRLPDLPQTTVYPYVAPIRAALSGRDRPAEAGFIFVGVEHIANVKALEWFYENVWPRFGETSPKISIIGSVSDKFSQHCPDIFQKHRSHFLGHVDDLAPHYAAAAAVLAPMVSGRGISVKTIEAVGAGKPVVGMPHAFRGIASDMIDECGIEVAETADEFADLMTRALTNPEPMRVASQKLHERLFQYDTFVSSMDRALKSVGIQV